ncbi:hypothetical protein BV25DRAFT_1919898 [Artomyces pyxidatus]|uniref:Uncharacterized protein n=1 Tax=Artomyces pyxidatus TaxID=48021 RepID=A0ACB8SMH4_9AGAM|nr:hypothetical protein BV25DRAFT_1919898 [Artomyces pyxidatus]
MFQNPIIQDTICAIWFKKSKKNAGGRRGKLPLGAEFQELFNPIPNVTIALVMSAVRYWLQVWKDTGTGDFADYVGEGFSVGEFVHYDRCLETIHTHAETPDMAPLWELQRRKLFSDAMQQFGAQPAATTTEPSVAPIPNLAEEITRLAQMHGVPIPSPSATGSTLDALHPSPGSA